MSGAYELILLDADGTLFDYDTAEACALEGAFVEAGLTYSPETHLQRYRVINKGLWLDYEKGAVTQSELRTERFRRLFQEIQGDASRVDLDRFSSAYLSCLARAAHLIGGAEEVCRRLSVRYRLAIVTNGITEVQMSRFRLSPLTPYIERVIVSEEAGHQKPDPRIFEYALMEMRHTDKSTVLMVGDSLTSDIQGGLNFGIHTCWYNPARRPNPSGPRPHMEIHDLEELMSL